MPKTDKNCMGGGALSANTPLNAALTSLLASEAEYIEKLAAVREVITGLRKMLGVEAPAAPAATSTRVPARIKKDPKQEHRSSQDNKATSRILSALARGPMSPGQLAAKLGIERPALRHHVKHLEAAGELVSTGATGNRQIALAGSPARGEP